MKICYVRTFCFGNACSLVFLRLFERGRKKVKPLLFASSGGEQKVIHLLEWTALYIRVGKMIIISLYLFVRRIVK